MSRIAFEVLLVVGLLAPAAARPASFRISNVPEVSQLDYTGCGAASLAMLLGFWGAPVDYKEVVDVVRSMAHGTSLPDMVRGAHFSQRSAAASEAYPASQAMHGYTTRHLGYGAFFYASRTPWLNQLKDVVARGYPVAVLTDWTPGESGPHYRVVTGYDDAQGVLFLHDPWSYGKSLARYRRAGTPGWVWPYKRFEQVWSLSTRDWGLPGGYRYGAVVCAPWKVRVQAPAVVAPGQTFPIRVTAEYRCPAPFGRGPGTPFPTFPATAAQLTLHLPQGLSAAGMLVKPLGTLHAGQVSAPAEFTVCADATGEYALTVTASGRVKGHVPEWGATYWKKAYDYTDVIGGEGAASISVGPPPHAP